MGIAVLLVGGIVAVGGLVTFARAVFGGSTFGRRRRWTARTDDDGGRAPRPDAHHAGTGPGSTGFGQWGPGG